MRAAVAESRPRPNGSKIGRPAENKRQKFERLAKHRTIAIIRRIHMLARIGRNASNYEFDEADVDRIIARLQGELEQLRHALNPPARQASIDFDFQN